MPGVQGKGGPPPKRSDQRRRRNNEGGQMNVTRAPGAESVTAPEADEQWHPVAAGWYRSLADSGQSQFYEPSDWWVAYYVAEAMSRNLAQGGKFSGVLFSSVLQAAGSELLASEGSRRRLRLELERSGTVDEDADRSKATVTDLRKRLGS